MLLGLSFISLIILLLISLYMLSKKNQKEKKEKEVNLTHDENISWECHLEHDRSEVLPCFTFEQIKTFYYTAPEK